MASETVANSPIGTYQVEVDRTATGSERQAVGIDIGTVTGDVLTPSRVSASNPLPVTGTVTATGTVTVDNGAGAAAVNIQDGGNSITVDGTVSITANSSVNVAQVGGTAVSLGQKTEAASIPVTLATTQDTADTDATYGNFTRIGVPWYDTGAETSGWKAWPVVGDGQYTSTPRVACYGIDESSGFPSQISVSTSAPNAGASLIGTRSLAYGIDGVTTRALKVNGSGVLAIQDDGGSITVDGTVAATQSGTWSVRCQDGSGNDLTSGTAAPAVAVRGLNVRAIQVNHDTGAGSMFNQGGNSLYGTSYVTELSSTGVSKSFGNGTSGTGVQRVTIASDSTGVISSKTLDGSGNSIVSATTLPGTSDRGLTTRSFAYLYDGDGSKISRPTSGTSYNDSGINVRQVTGALGSAAEPSQYATLRGHYYVGSRTTTTGSTTTVINTTTDPSTIAGAGYYVRVISGSFSTGLYEDAPIASCSSSAITLKHPLRVAPGSGLTVYIYKPTTPLTDSTGQLYTNTYVSNTVNVVPTAGNKFYQAGGILAFGSISGSYATVLTTPGTVNMLAVANLTNAPMIFSFDGGSNDALALGAGQTTTFALTTNGGFIDSSQDIQVKDDGTTSATSGFVHVGVYYA